MRLELSEATIVDELIANLRDLDCVVEREGPCALEVTVPQSGEPWHPENQAQVELAFLVRAWLTRHPGVDFRLLESRSAPRGRRR